MFSNHVATAYDGEPDRARSARTAGAMTRVLVAAVRILPATGGRPTFAPVPLSSASPSCTPGGKCVTAIAREGGSSTLVNYPLDGAPPRKLVEFPELGHSPQVEAPDRFHEALLAELAIRP